MVVTDPQARHNLYFYILLFSFSCFDDLCLSPASLSGGLIAGSMIPYRAAASGPPVHRPVPHFPGLASTPIRLECRTTLLEWESCPGPPAPLGQDWGATDACFGCWSVLSRMRSDIILGRSLVVHRVKSSNVSKVRTVWYSRDPRMRARVGMASRGMSWPSNDPDAISTGKGSCSRRGVWRNCQGTQG